jgi:hypothetical protein
MTEILPIFSSIIGLKAARAVNRNHMAILLGTLVLLVLAAPISEVETGHALLTLAPQNLRRPRRATNARRCNKTKFHDSVL